MNNGRKIVLSLEEINASTSVPTGSTKPNVEGDPDYIAPYTDLTDCPFTATTTCPDAIGTVTTDSFEVEFSIIGSVYGNSLIQDIKVVIKQGSTEIQTETVPKSTFVNVLFETLTSGTEYTIDVIYLDNVGGTVATCTAVLTKTTL